MWKFVSAPLFAMAFVGIVPVAGAVPTADGAEFIVGTSVFLADFDVSSTCSGPATVTLIIHKPGGDDVRQVEVENVIAPADCFATRCFECPPVPVPIAWTMTGPGVDLVGAGVIIYDHYGYFELAWSVVGSFEEGRLEAHSAYG